MVSLKTFSEGLYRVMLRKRSKKLSTIKLENHLIFRNSGISILPSTSVIFFRHTHRLEIDSKIFNGNYFISRSRFYDVFKENMFQKIIENAGSQCIIAISWWEDLSLVYLQTAHYFQAPWSSLPCENCLPSDLL